VTPLTKKLIETDWSMMYRLLYEDFYPIRLNKSQTFGHWVQQNVKIEHFSPAMVIRTGSHEGEPVKIRYWVLLSDGDNFQCDVDDYIDPLGHLDREDWEREDKEAL
jgi:hypothetical protein